ncbi:MAG: L-seryl-tRNA(Sec) selenium transferase, partial [Chloroflexota bacterium]
LQGRAAAWAAALGFGEVLPGRSTVGGGSLPGETLPTWLLALSPRSPERALGRLRQCSPPVIARTQDDRVVLDPRTVLTEQEPALLQCLQQVFGSPIKHG